MINRYNFNEAYCLTDPGFDTDSAKYYEGLMTQGNGYMHVRASFDEGLPSVNQAEEYERKPANVTLEKGKKQPSKWGTYVPGVVGKHPNLMTEIVNLPYFFKTGFTANGEVLSMENSSVSDYVRYLDMRDGSLTRNLTWVLKSGARLKLEYFRFISLSNKHLAFSFVTATCMEGAVDLTFDTGIDAGVRTNGFNHFDELRFVNDGESIGTKLLTNGKNEVLIKEKVILCDTTLNVEQKGDYIYYAGSTHLERDESISFVKVISVSTTSDNEGVVCDNTYLDLVTKDTISKLYEDHKKAWTLKWENSEIKIKGDEKTERALRFSTYHLLRSCNEENDKVAICAKGYAGEAYFGRYFWDTEINMLPFFIYTNPEAARSLLLFRYNTLEGAKKNAASYGYRGARYPWESSISGEEECACWQYADHEIHVTADIIYAMMHYVNATGDIDFIREYGIDIMVETARYWVDRVDKDKDGNYVLLSVMGPDEYLPMTSNNAYTNRMVKFALDTTVASINALKVSEGYEKIRERLAITNEDIVSFEDVAKNIKIAFDKNTDIILQCDEFMSYADLDFDKIWTDRSKCFGNFISQEKNYRSKALKQADVLEMMMLFPKEFTSEQFVKNYDYYEPITTHDSSLSAAVHGIIASWINRIDTANDFLNKVIDIDLSKDKKGAEEGIHIANCGGLWQMVVFGFAGLKSGMYSDEITFTPNLPDSIEEIVMPINWHGKKLIYKVTRSGYELI